jgi:hypothetical protein
LKERARGEKAQISAPFSPSWNTKDAGLMFSKLENYSKYWLDYNPYFPLGTQQKTVNFEFKSKPVNAPKPTPYCYKYP